MTTNIPFLINKGTLETATDVFFGKILGIIASQYEDAEINEALTTQISNEYRKCAQKLLAMLGIEDEQVVPGDTQLNDEIFEFAERMMNQAIGPLVNQYYHEHFDYKDDVPCGQFIASVFHAAYNLIDQTAAVPTNTDFFAHAVVPIDESAGQENADTSNAIAANEVVLYMGIIGHLKMDKIAAAIDDNTIEYLITRYFSSFDIHLMDEEDLPTIKLGTTTFSQVDCPNASLWVEGRELPEHKWISLFGYGQVNFEA